QAGPQGLGDVGEEAFLRMVVATENGQFVAVKPPEDTQAGVLRLENPGGIVERFGHQGTKHGTNALGQRRTHSAERRARRANAVTRTGFGGDNHEFPGPDVFAGYWLKMASPVPFRDKPIAQGQQW